MDTSEKTAQDLEQFVTQVYSFAYPMNIRFMETGILSRYCTCMGFGINNTNIGLPYFFLLQTNLAESARKIIQDFPKMEVVPKDYQLIENEREIIEWLKNNKETIKERLNRP
jgi:hypothetical protein